MIAWYLRLMELLRRRRVKALYERDQSRLRKFFSRYKLKIRHSRVVCSACGGNCGACGLDATIAKGTTMYHAFKQHHAAYTEEQGNDS